MTTSKRMGLLALGAVVAAAGSAWAASDMLRELEDAFVRLHEDVRPCVVNIDTTGPAKTMEDNAEEFEDLFRFFGVPTPDGGLPRHRGIPREGTGSGFIYDKQGHIITNNHVVEGAEKIVVRLWDGSEHDAEIVGTDPDTDVAVIKIEPNEELPTARLGDSAKLRVGQFAVAMGSPRGFEGSLSFGHVSALGRDKLRLPGLRFQDFIQTDAGINLGNSGGPLCDIDGEVIGINVAILFGANSIGFAIPINTAKSILPELISQGKVTRGYLGVAIDDASMVADVPDIGLPDTKGAFVKEVQPDTPAERAGIERYDVIRKVNGAPVDDASDLIRLISAESPGATVMLEVWRNGETLEIEVLLAEWQGVEALEEQNKILGVEVRTLTAPLAERLGLDTTQRGVIVTALEPASPADEAGLAPGDVITEVAQEPVATVEQFMKQVRARAEPGKSLLIGYIRSGGGADITVIRVPKDAELE